MPFYYVNTGQRDWTEQEFFATGEQNVRDQILNDLDNICQGRNPADMRVLEIGCGVGRLTRALAAIFGEVHAVDISPKMVALAQRFLRSTPNAHVYCNSGRDLQVLGALHFDFAYSFIVFQHIPSLEIIDDYVREVSTRLHPGSLFKFQVQGYPNAKLRRQSRDTWLGISVSEQEVAEMAGRHGFEIRHTSGAGTQYYWLSLSKR